MKQNLPIFAILLIIANTVNSCSDDKVPDLPQPCGEFGYYDTETYYCYTELRQRCDSTGSCDILYSTCYVSEKPGNSAYYVMTCGTTAAEWPKAMCEGVAYDPAKKVCSSGKVFPYFTYLSDNKKYETMDMVTKTDWETAKTVCLSGWNLPSNEEWDGMYHYADSTNFAMPEGSWWSDSEYDSNNAYFRDTSATYNYTDKNDSLSVRCVKFLLDS
jgi:hypothetical protein